MNKQKGNMYGFVTHTWNPIKGRCSHKCAYCYMKPFWKSEVHLDEKDLNQDLGEGNFIFIGSSTDMFAENIPHTWIYSILTRCKKYPKNTYLFQSKNPSKFIHFKDYFPKNTILGTTIESDSSWGFSNPPSMLDRAEAMSKLDFTKMVTIEPIMDFEFNNLVQLIRIANPKWVNIGADSKGHKLPEPNWGKVMDLIKVLNSFTEVKQKKNLDRLRKSVSHNIGDKKDG